MPKMFPVEVRLFVVDKKKEGHSWERVTELLQQQFNIDPPSRRQMVKWLKTTDRPAINHVLDQKVKKELETKKGKAIAVAMEDLLPRLWKARDMGEDVEYRGWSWFFGIQENVLGSKKYWQFLERYKNERQGQPDYSPTPPPWDQETLSEQDQQNPLIEQVSVREEELNERFKK
jgi:hypothetical protein